MQRKLIKQGGGGLTIYLPKKWIDKNHLKPKQLVNVTEKDNQLIVAEKGAQERKNAEIDITNMSRNAFIKVVTAYYENGYHEIVINKTEKLIHNPWKNKKKSVNEEIEFLVNRLIGFEIISSQKDKTIIRDVSITSPEEFDNILRRIFYLILEYQEAAKNFVKNSAKIANNEGYHDNITKFISFCNRLLSQNMEKTETEKINLHTILALLDKVVDETRYLVRDHNNLEKTKDKQIIYGLVEHFRKFYDFFYKPSYEIINELDEKRAKLKLKALKSEDAIIIRFANLLEIVQALIKPTLCLSSTKQKFCF